MARRRRGLDNIQLLVFDVGNTIVDANLLIDSSATHAANKFARLGFVAHPLDLAKSYLRASAGVSHEHVNRIFSDPVICRGALADAGLPCDPHHSLLLLTFFREELRRLLARDADLVLLLRDLKGRGLDLCAVSDGTTVEQYELLERLGVLTLFDYVVISEAFGKEKISTDIFEHILKRFRVGPERAAMVGDEIQRDMVWAYNAGYATVLQEQFGSPAGNLMTEFGWCIDYRINSLAEIRRLLPRTRADSLEGRA